MMIIIILIMIHGVSFMHCYSLDGYTLGSAVIQF